MTKKETSFLSVDGKTNIHVIQWIPEKEPYKAILQITHGMIEFIDRYDKFASFLSDNGILVVGHDHLGHGESVVTKEDWGYIGDGTSDWLIADMHTLRTNTMKEFPGVPYFMLGHSMGSYMLRKYLARYSEGLAGTIIMGTGYMPESTTKMAMTISKFLAKLFGWKHRSKFVESCSFAGPYKRYDVTGKDVKNSWLTKDTEIVAWYYHEPACTFKFTLNAYMALFEAVLEDCRQESVEKITKDLPVFIVSGQDDPVGDMGAGVKKVYDMFKEAGNKDVTYRLYENDRHEILNETDREKVFSDILAWILVHVEIE